MTIEELQKAVHDNSKAHGFWDDADGKSIPTKLMLIVSEAAEALECYRDGEMDLLIDANGKPTGFPSEIADVVIRCLDLAEHLGVNLGEVMEAKHEYNVKRPFKHGRRC